MKIVRHAFAGILLLGRGLAFAAGSSTPEISFSLRGVAGTTVEQGEPLRIVVRVKAPRGAKEAIALAPANQSWSEAITVEIRPAAGGPPVASAESVGKPESTAAKLDEGHIAGGLWHFTSEAMERVAVGKYFMHARLTIRQGSGWIGEIISSELPLEVVAPSDSAERSSQRAVNRAYAALLNERLEEAANLLDLVLKKNPGDARVLTARAEIALRAGNPAAALVCINRATPAKSRGQPPIEREELLTRIMAAVHAGTTPPVNPPSWSWPPATILEPTLEQKDQVRKIVEGNNPRSPGSSKPPAGLTTPKTPPPAPPSNGPVAAASLSTRSESERGHGVVRPAADFNDAKVRADAQGQWAESATAGSQYGRTQYSAAQATGAPNVSVAGNSPDAWCPANKEQGEDWLEVTFAKPAHATEIRIRQNDAAGAVAKIEATDANGIVHLWWAGADPYIAPATRDIAWFAVRVPPTDYLVAKVKITLNLASGPGWKEIDAVQLVAADGAK